MQPVPTRISREKAACIKCEKLLTNIPSAGEQRPSSDDLAKEKLIESLYEEHLRRYHGMSK